MKVLNLWSDQAPLTPVDLFAEEPFDFSEAFNKAVEETLASGHRFRFVDIETLIEMKRKSGRPIDLEDIRNLELLRDG